MFGSRQRRLFLWQRGDAPLIVPFTPFKRITWPVLWQRDYEDEKSRVGAAIVHPTANGQLRGNNANVGGPKKCNRNGLLRLDVFLSLLSCGVNES